MDGLWYVNIVIIKIFIVNDYDGEEKTNYKLNCNLYVILCTNTGMILRIKMRSSLWYFYVRNDYVHDNVISFARSFVIFNKRVISSS